MAAVVPVTPIAFLQVVTAAKLDTAAIDGVLRTLSPTWDDSPELREFFSNPAVPPRRRWDFLTS